MKLLKHLWSNNDDKYTIQITWYFEDDSIKEIRKVENKIQWFKLENGGKCWSKYANYIT